MRDELPRPGQQPAKKKNKNKSNKNAKAFPHQITRKQKRSIDDNLTHLGWTSEHISTQNYQIVCFSFIPFVQVVFGLTFHPGRVYIENRSVRLATRRFTKVPFLILPINNIKTITVRLLSVNRHLLWHQRERSARHRKSPLHNHWTLHIYINNNNNNNKYNKNVLV